MLQPPLHFRLDYRIVLVGRSFESIINGLLSLASLTRGIVDAMGKRGIRKAPGKDNFRLKRKVAAWDDDFLASLIAA